VLDVRGGQIHDRWVHALPQGCLTVAIRSVADGAGLQIDLLALDYDLLIVGERVLQILSLDGDHYVFRHIGQGRFNG